MTHPVLVTDVAETHILTVDTWWRENRTWAPDLFIEELAAAFEMLRSSPKIGKSYPHATVSTVRRLLLRATRNHVYYRIDSPRIWVLAVWGAVRGIGPELT